jgi:p-hydroxybenzoate 3-monooxygenase
MQLANPSEPDVSARIRSGILTHYSNTLDRTLLDGYSETFPRRWWMTSMLHRWNEHDDLDRRRQLAELRQVTGSPAAATAFAENYAGPPML